MTPRPPRSTLFPYTTLFRSLHDPRLLAEPFDGVRAGAALVVLVGSRKRDRKSTRLNSSHRCISYAVFCLKKKRVSDAESVILSQGAEIINGSLPAYGETQLP